MLNKIYEEQKTTNRNLQRISNVILMAVFAGLGINAKEHDNEQGRMLCRMGLYLTAISQGLLIATDIYEVVKKRRRENITK